jgi:Ni2+-binding GTPase involved in maturation of urease and hydrogenase
VKIDVAKNIPDDNARMDAMAFVDFRVARFMEGVRAVNAKAPVFQVSRRTGEGPGDWIAWLKTIRS